jgi:hypothetical protein
MTVLSVTMSLSQKLAILDMHHLRFYGCTTPRQTAGRKPVQVPPYHGHIMCKTITIGEEVAWIDLKRDIVFCDVLAENPKFHVVSLPLPIKELPDPRSVRDIAILDGCIYFVDLHHQFNDDYTVDGWSATKWSMKISSCSEAWHLDHKLCSSNISGSSKIEGNAHMAQPNLQRLYLGLPNLSLQDKDLVYCLAKIHLWDSEQTAWVISLDFRNNTIHEAVEYNAIKKVGLSIGYSASRISKYLIVAPSTCQSDLTRFTCRLLHMFVYVGNGVSRRCH